MGMVQDAEVVEPSGNPTLDTEAVDALKRGRLPPFPAHWTLERLSLMAQFDYVFQ
jgi:TonB family protein